MSGNEAVIPTLTDEKTVILSDALNHASIVEGVRLSKPAASWSTSASWARWT